MPASGRWLVVLFLAGEATHQTQTAAVRCLLRIASNCSRGTLHMQLCFVPRRTCAQISYILVSFRHGLNIPSATWNEQGETLSLGRLQLSVSDVPITLSSIDREIYTSTFKFPYNLIHSEGNTLGMNILLDNVKLIIAHSATTSIISLIGIGADGEIIAKKIASHLIDDLNGTVDIAPLNTTNDQPRTATHDIACARGKYSLDGSFDEIAQLHNYAAQMLGSHAAGAESSIAQNSATTCASPGILTDELLSRCLVRQGETHDSDLQFVRDNMRVSGLTRRAHQTSFKIRICESRSRIDQFTALSRFDVNIKSIIVFDRAFDWISPFLTPFTYEAMLDLQWGIDANKNLQVPTTKKEHGETVKLDGELFLRLRDLLLSDIGPCLHEEALRIQAQTPAHGSKMTGSTGTVNEMHQTLLKMKEYEKAHRELSVHIRLVSDLIQNLWKNPAFYTLLRVEDDILNNPSVSIDAHVATLCQLAWRNAPLVDVIRLLMLTILVKGPTAGSRIVDVRGVMVMVRSVLRALASVHGPITYQVWYHLEASVFKSPINKTEWPTAHPPNSQAPIGFVHSGVCPLSIEILEAIVKQYQHQACHSSNVWRQKIKMPNSASRDGDILLVFPHHVTYSELAALRCLAKSISRNFIVLTGSVMGYKSFVLNDRSRYSDLLSETVL